MNPFRSTRWLFLILLIVGLAAAPGAFAQGRGKASKAGSLRHRGLDVNNDGRIQRSEWRGSERSFNAHDRNQDGVLSGTELDPALQAGDYEDFAGVDRDRDGRVNRTEWRWDRAEFERMDENRDGVISREEYADVVGGSTISSPSVSGSTGGNTTGVIAPGTGTERRTTGTITAPSTSTAQTPEAMFERLDSNGNGTINRDEWSGDKQSFNRLDVDNDGKLGRKEFMKRYDNLEEKFTSLDKDHNGSVSRQEWREEKKQFDRLDDNHDGQLSLAEFTGVR